MPVHLDSLKRFVRFSSTRFVKLNICRLTLASFKVAFNILSKHLAKTTLTKTDAKSSNFHSMKKIYFSRFKCLVQPKSVWLVGGNIWWPPHVCQSIFDDSILSYLKDTPIYVTPELWNYPTLSLIFCSYLLYLVSPSVSVVVIWLAKLLNTLA